VAVQLMLRSLYDKQRNQDANTEARKKFLTDMEHTFEFMKSSRLHNVGCLFFFFFWPSFPFCPLGHKSCARTLIACLLADLFLLGYAIQPT
jgi:hypothetical protein